MTYMSFALSININDFYIPLTGENKFNYILIIMGLLPWKLIPMGMFPWMISPLRLFPSTLIAFDLLPDTAILWACYLEH